VLPEPAWGLSRAEAARRLAAEGPNLLPGSGRRSTLAIALEVLREPMFLLLVAAASVYLLLGDVREALVLAASIVVVMAITVAQERKSERALEALRDLSSPRALVVRDGRLERIAGAQVVRGDLLVLEEGDRVPADASLAAANDLMIDESLLTGESLPVEKSRGMQVYSGTLVVKGQGRAEVSATGAATEFGKIGTSLATLEIEKTSLQRETARLVKIVAVSGLLLCTLLAAFYVAKRGDTLGGILAGLTLAMALLPEEFPVVLTVFLALGAWRISRHRVLTRRMPAIETLGAATVLCVDKTGTLTQNRMALADAIAAPGVERVSLAEGGEGDHRPRSGMGVLAAVLPDAGRIALDVSRIERRALEGRREQQRQALVAANELLVHDGHRTPGAGRLRRPGQYGPGLRDRVDAALVARGGAERRAVVEVAAPVPIAVPALPLERSAKLRGVP